MEIIPAGCADQRLSADLRALRPGLRTGKHLPRLQIPYHLRRGPADLYCLEVLYVSSSHRCSYLRRSVSTSHHDRRGKGSNTAFHVGTTKAKLVRLNRPVVACHRAFSTAAMIRASTPPTLHAVCLMTKRSTHGKQPGAFSPNLTRRLRSATS
jgi:hypothetical protein